MIKVERDFAHGYDRPVNRGVCFWNGDKVDRQNPERCLDDLVYKALGE